ncbi:MAG: dUTP diphosphatase [Balneolales bacterium]|nr:dUTP diphosphatase [Balneolales bacterium]
MITLKVKRLAHSNDLPLPAYETSGSSGMDICAAIDKPLELKSGERTLIPTGFCFEIPDGFEIQVRPRSGLAIRSGITLLNTPGTIDSDYRGEVKIIVINHGSESVKISRGDRIAQLVIQKIWQVQVVDAIELESTIRGKAGFGSTGV